MTDKDDAHTIHTIHTTMIQAKQVKSKLTQELLRELLDYNPKTGDLTWKRRDRKLFKNNQSWSAWNNNYNGAVAGCINTRGYLVIRILGKNYYAHRLAYLHENGCIQEGLSIDHVNHNRTDNRIINLRLVDGRDNQRNRLLNRNNKSGVCGVNRKNNKWRASIRVGNKEIHVGYFLTIDEAVIARRSAEIKFGFHPNHGNLGVL